MRVSDAALNWESSIAQPRYRVSTTKSREQTTTIGTRLKEQWEKGAAGHMKEKTVRSPSKRIWHSPHRLRAFFA
jgi:hypothetical protein